MSVEELDGHWRTITDIYDPALKALTPGGGAYLNEVHFTYYSSHCADNTWAQANPFESEWKQAFYGDNYERLLKIKDKYDPSDVLYGRTNVGGDRWDVSEDGRLCRAS